MASPTAPVLVRRADRARRRTTWDAAGRRVLEHSFGFLRVLGGPGTGKSTLIAELAADRIRHRGVSPENVLVLTASRRAAAWMRTEITRLLTGTSSELRTAPEPLVRTVHSYAFAVLRLQAVRDELPPPQLPPLQLPPPPPRTPLPAPRPPRASPSVATSTPSRPASSRRPPRP